MPDESAKPLPIRPMIRSIQDLDATVETRDPKTGAFQYVTFYVFTDDDVVFFGQLPKAASEITAEEATAALSLVPDHTIFPPVAPGGGEWTLAPDDGVDNKSYFVKQPTMSIYDLFKDDDFLARLLLGEATIMERLAKHWHPNIVRYHGIRVRRGRMTGLVLDRHRHTLLEHVKQGLGGLDEVAFIQALESAVTHLHSLGLAHNDLNPENIMVNEADGMPILIDFGSCRPFGGRLLTLGTKGWVDDMDIWSSLARDMTRLPWIKSGSGSRAPGSSRARPGKSKLVRPTSKEPGHCTYLIWRTAPGTMPRKVLLYYAGR